MAHLTELSDQDFHREVIESTVPVLIDFWAPWCGPCRMITPIVDELASENAGTIKVFKVNVDDCPNVATHYQISSIPTLLIFKDGEVVDQIIGVRPKSQLQAALDRALA